MIEIQNKKKLGKFKDSVSLPGLVQKYLGTKNTKNLAEEDYFAEVGTEHAHIYKQLRPLGIVGGPSMIFHRYQEASVTKIKEVTC